MAKDAAEFGNFQFKALSCYTIVMLTYWIFFNVVILLLLIADLFVFHNKSKVMTLKQSVLWSLFWIGLALSFNAFIYFTHGKEKAIDFLAGYLIEKSLSIDNVFVFILIFRAFKTPKQYIHKTLFWGVLGAIVLRGLFILLGVTLISHFHQILYLLGIFLIYSGIKLFFEKEKKAVDQENYLIRTVRKFIPVTDTYEDGKFFVRKSRILATPLFLTLIAVELTDVIFALDSIPAIFAITLDPFIVYTSNIFAILGLRALYFVLANLIAYFRFLHYAIALLLILAGLKMILSDYIIIPIIFALGSIFIILSTAVILSLIFPKKKL